ncbi:NAD(P)/FAD-dependent oxidoreductase [Pseudomonas sp. NPDC087804]|uniref:NAD(P)/FAD-dependent oxidoreductase n=1 Tax=Pseudomonas sp. NPDC087804 TaxID=3364449 RepID=UPI003802ACF5
MTQLSMVIIGAGHSGSKAAAALRKNGWTGPITLIGAESHLPYNRPPLSKVVLLGKKTAKSCTFFQRNWYKDQDIDVVLGNPAEVIDRTQKMVILADGTTLNYHRLLFATGAEPNVPAISGIELENVWPLRTPEHADAIAGALKPKTRLAIIGAGAIGLEVAAAAVERGCNVHIIEATSQVMGRSVPATFASIIMNMHLSRRVIFHLNTRVISLTGDSSVQSVLFESGERLDCDVVVYGIGVRPCTHLAESSGLSVKNGIQTNARLTTSDESIFACGDVCAFESARYGRVIRLENWKNAEAQAEIAARSMLGEDISYDPVPWFWSNQYDWTIQVTGLVEQSGIIETLNTADACYFINLDCGGRLLAGGAIGSVRNVGSVIRKISQQIQDGFCLENLTSGSVRAAITALVDCSSG